MSLFFEQQEVIFEQMGFSGQRWNVWLDEGQSFLQIWNQCGSIDLKGVKSGCISSPMDEYRVAESLSVDVHCS